MLTIGQVASRTGLRASAIRYYESRGLLPRPERVGGKRVYHGSIVERLAVIRLAKAAGFDLNEVGSALAAAGDDDPAARWKVVAKAKRLELDAEMKRLLITKYVLSRISACSCETVEECGRAFLDGLSKRPRDLAPADGRAAEDRRRRSAKKLARRRT